MMIEEFCSDGIELGKFALRDKKGEYDDEVDESFFESLLVDCH